MTLLKIEMYFHKVKISDPAGLGTISDLFEVSKDFQNTCFKSFTGIQAPTSNKSYVTFVVR